MTASIYGQLADERRRDLLTAAEEYRRVRLARRAQRAQRAQRRRLPDDPVQPTAAGGVEGSCLGMAALAGGR